ncbi:hypothetical protein [Natrononativus amylolyticus]|uniref:hypothetical protein n=1 Tax=Natrononativus amylolyticus TaxID=2963434 RepID=UPI0020CB81A6|nr:hypothetical protein [Natrononativus amylolyticus]
MKRALTLMLTVALVGSLMFMGLAGTAAADSHTEIDVQLGGDGGDGGDAVNFAQVNQQNNNAQVGYSSASSVGHHSAAASSVNQWQSVSQTNAANVNQLAVGGDGGDGGDSEIEIDLPVFVFGL